MISTVVRETFSDKRRRLMGVHWCGDRARELLEHCPTPPENSRRVTAGYRDYELIDVGNERWRFQFGRPVAYFLYTTDPDDPRRPWAAVWLDDKYGG